jgi:hypothetical protein
VPRYGELFLLGFETLRELWRLTQPSFRTFTGPDQWVISLPVVATLLLLMTHPTKAANHLTDNPDRDLSWTLDSLHGFCRKEGLEEGNRHLSWSLGTFPDRWMYLNFPSSTTSPPITRQGSGSAPVSDATVIPSPFPSEAPATQKFLENSESGTACVPRRRTRTVTGRTRLS